ncbi:uncharacterized protein F5Z01DRAFT_614770 [Emericellopsis atlantica]|uniref:Peptidase M20 dimerisation domain-containing protein n=1 Tax=Emericellopsis atlantica TaxID=2614577 RepID=A0A9P7ZWK4_9HYPO|nr:uncharacterized protein F5Z01DRAFT_614770 [Emericellopsis atlantica]KAG9258902.1 hypothetical protein F5Z01DRAFT_614770 [Emericellopsis atlantica]
MSLKAALVLAAGATAWVTPSRFAEDQFQLTKPSPFKCDLPPALEPAGDDLENASSLFTGRDALDRQVKRHQGIVRVPSVSYDDNGEPGEDSRWEPFYTLHDVLRELYPNIHHHAKLDKINTFGLVYTLTGSDASLKPTLLTAHQDVVPVPDPSTWTHPPFDAHFDGEWLWGRGAADDKSSLTALMSAVEALLEQGWTPKRTLVLAFGYDEECSGYRGATKIGEYLTEKYGDDGVAVILDEGGLGFEAPEENVLYALPSVMEKGHMDIWLTLSFPGGHSSVPLAHTAIGVAAEIVSTLEANPFEPQLLENGPTHRHLICNARYSPDANPTVTRLVKKGDLQGLADEVIKVFGRGGRYMLQTSQAVDVIQGGTKINAMPETVAVGVNYRISPQDSIESIQDTVLANIKTVVDKYGLDVKAFQGEGEGEASAAVANANGTLYLEANQVFQPTPTAPTEGKVWDVFSGTIQHTFGSGDARTVVPVGEIMLGNTDTRHYLNLSPNVYRWNPISRDAAINIHTVDERLRMEDQLRMVQFYYDFVRNFDQADL